MTFVTLPKYILLGLYADWLVLESIVNLDTANCNKNERCVFLNILCCGWVKFASDFPNKIASLAFPWMYKKNLQTPAGFEAVFINSIFTENSCKKTNITRYCMEPAITISASHVQNSSLMAIVDALKFCRHLKSLSFSETNSNNLQTCDSLVLNLCAIKRTALTTFNFCDLEILTDVQIILICDNYPHMTCLNVSGCKLLTDMGICHIPSSCDEMISLNLSRTKISDITLSRLNNRCQKLKDLALGGCTLLRFSVGKLRDYFLKNGSNFFSVDITEISSTSVVEAIGKTCHNLTSLRLGTSFATISSLCQNCKLISTLNLDGCKRLNVDSGVLLMKSLIYLSDFSFNHCSHHLQFVFFCLMAQKLKALSCLKLHDNHVIGEPLVDLALPLVCDETNPPFTFYLSNYAALQMVDKCSNLSVLSVAATNSSDCLLYFRSFKCPDIVSFSITGNANINDDHLARVCVGWSSLLKLHLMNCLLITSFGLVSVCGSCPLIQDVLLEGRTRTRSEVDDFFLNGDSFKNCEIDDMGLIFGVSKLKFLRKLNLHELPLVTKAGFGAIINSCAKLHDVKVSRCCKLSCVEIEKCLAVRKILNSSLFSK